MTMKPRVSIALACLGLALLAAACSDGPDSSSASGKGQVQIAMTTGTGPAAAATASESMPALESANVTFSKIQARTVEGTWVDVLISLPTTIDVLTLRDGKTVQLPAGLLPPGNYDGLSLTITKVEVVTADGTQIAITPPPGGWTVQVPTGPFVVVEGESTAIRIKFREDLSFHALDGAIGFDPDFECED